jgi:hypothetical protein
MKPAKSRQNRRPAPRAAQYGRGQRMPKTYRVRDLLKALSKDELRTVRPFERDVADTNDVLWNAHLDSEEKQVMLLNWLQHKQSCMFGRIAASKGWLHLCLLDDSDLRKSDQHIATKIKAEVLAWKRRSIRPRPDVSTPAHGFLLALASNWVANAAPDKHLRRVAEEILKLWGCPVTKEPAGKVYWETLFLEDPSDSSVTAFEFSVDFFAAQGDGRWWRDHRIPGGFAFTANSVGHMQRYQELYHGKPNQTEWALTMAIDTIHRAADVNGTRATWLRQVNDHGPFDKKVPCPFPDAFASDPLLKGVDWTRYEGYLHTDHSIRPEFFYPDASLPTAVASKRYVLDFVYLYDKNVRDHKKFIAGIPISREAVEQIIGSEADWVLMKAQPRIRVRGTATISNSDVKELKRVRELVKKSRRWRMSAKDLKNALR